MKIQLLLLPIIVFAISSCAQPQRTKVTQEASQPVPEIKLKEIQIDLPYFRSSPLEYHHPPEIIIEESFADVDQS